MLLALGLGDKCGRPSFATTYVDLEFIVSDHRVSCVRQLASLTYDVH